MTFHAYVRAIADTILIKQISGLTVLKDGVEQAGHALVTPGDNWVSLTIRHRLDPRTSYGYTPATFDVYCKSTGQKWQLACPALIGGVTPVDDNIGIIAGYNGWAA